MDLGLAGKVALVLGASRGLGAASARALAAEGAQVHAISRSGSVEDGALQGFAADLSIPQGVDALLSHIAAIGRVDVLVANTGGPRRGTAQGVPGSEWLAVFQALAVSQFRIADAVLPGMVKRGWGRIITIGSSGIEQPIPDLALSNAVRGSVAGWSKTLAAEVAKHGVTVNMVLPGRIDTDRLREGDASKARGSGLDLEHVQAASRAGIPAGRYGKPDEFGAVVAFLASVQASYVTGSMVRVDGGLIRSI
ncbi:SDR family oxidoreductase [Novosphingobium terrae]|uniref:SDR family oxidoreductase n=1 Tax=Novosphingobium terrae TaxID=2726189 RepID=UPI001981028D|nr:SDR family oxidoreductase [Novosphingobium terrae]